MLHDLHDLLGSRVDASDGEMGNIRNFLFDDRSWRIRYLVVDVGRLLNRQEVVLAVSFFEKPNWANQSCQVRYTKKQVSNSPDVDSQMPVSRQQEIAMRDYFAGEQFWIDAGLGAGPPILPGADLPVNSEEEDPHLRSVVDLSSYEVWASDGEIGHLHGFVMDEVTWHLGYLDVRAGRWLCHRSVLIPTRLVESISYTGRRIRLQHTRDGI